MTAPIAFRASLFSVVLGLCGLGQAWHVAEGLWQVPSIISSAILLGATLVWLMLLLSYVAHAIRNPAQDIEEFNHPVIGGTPALLGVSTVLICVAVLPYSRTLAWALAVGGISWHLLYSIWHTGGLWQGNRQAADTVPSLYLPTVAGNFTSAAALGALGCPDWAWLFLGTGVFSWFALESLMMQRLWHGSPLPVAQRSLLGIQFAPPVVCASALLLIAPDTPHSWLLMLLGYGIFQLLTALRLKSWLTAQAFSYAWWAYSFGVVSATVVCLKLAVAQVPAAIALAIPIFIFANLFIGYLSLRSATQLFARK